MMSMQWPWPGAVALSAAGVVCGMMIGYTAASSTRLQDSSVSDLRLSSFVDTDSAPVNRVRKGDRLDLIEPIARLESSFAHAQSDTSSISGGGFGMPPLCATPATCMLAVSKGVGPASYLTPGHMEPSWRSKPPESGSLMPASRRANCEPLASPVADPLLARFAGRCLAQL